MHKWLGILLLGILVSCSSENKRLQEGDQAPDFVLTSVDGAKVGLQEFKGKQVLLHFWADWCADCRAEFPRLQKAQQKYSANSFEIVAINVAQSAEHVQTFKDDFSITFPMLMDRDGKVAERYHIRGLPTNFFLDENGRIQKIIIGWVVEKQIARFVEQGENEP